MSIIGAKLSKRSDIFNWDQIVQNWDIIVWIKYNNYIYYLGIPVDSEVEPLSLLIKKSIKWFKLLVGWASVEPRPLVIKWVLLKPQPPSLGNWGYYKNFNFDFSARCAQKYFRKYFIAKDNILKVEKDQTCKNHLQL